MKKLMIPVLGALVLTGCGTVTKEQIIANRFEYNTEQVEKTVNDIPDWYIDLPDEEGKIYAAGSAKTPDLQLTLDLAMLNAKTTLADSLNSKVQSQTKSFITKLGSDDVDSSVITNVEKVTKNLVVDVDVSGWATKEVEVQPSGTQYLVYVMLEYSGTRASEVLYNRLSRDKELIGRIRSSEAFVELENEVEAVRENESTLLGIIR